MPNVSICLPLYNGERYLTEAIESVLAQTHSDYELLILDDCSQDGSLEIARSFASRDYRVTVLSNTTNLGLFANYNACMKRASGKFIKLFAQDDLLAPTALERMLDVFSTQEDVALVTCSRLTIDQDGQTRRVNEQLDSTRIIAGEQAIEGCLSNLHNWIGEPSAVMFPTEFVGTGFDTGFYHIGDLEFWFRILAYGALVYLHEPLCSFRFHPASATTKNMKTLLYTLDALRFGRMYQQHLAEMGVSWQDYLRQTLDFGAHFVHDLVRKEGVTGEDIAAIDLGNLDQKQLLKQFRELAFCALFYAQDTRLNVESAKNEIDSERLYAEDKLSGVLKNPVWRAAKALRLT